MTCVDCGQEFVFTSGEQSFYAQRGFTEAPKRCAACRSARKAQRNAASDGGASYGGGSSRGDGDGGYSGGGYSTGGYDSGGYGGERRPRQLFAAVCAECGRTAQVPFQPTGARPVYCSDCFQTHR